ncbi:MAG: hypothetical protein ACREFO_17465 [Acetobacteraceae bacterium]
MDEMSARATGAHVFGQTIPHFAMLPHMVLLEAAMDGSAWRHGMGCWMHWRGVT